MTILFSARARLWTLVAMGLAAVALACPGYAEAYGAPRPQVRPTAPPVNVVPQVIPRPELGIEGVPVMPENIFSGLPEGTPTGDTAPDGGELAPTSPNSPTAGEKILNGILKGAVKQGIKYLNPGLGLVVAVGDGAVTVYKITKDGIKKLNIHNEAVQKSLIGQLGSGLQLPPPDPVLMSPGGGIGGGGGPGPLHDFGVW